MNIREELHDIFRNVFFDDELMIFDEMTADDVEDWNSLSHLNLIAAIEKHFKIQFTTEEMLDAVRFHCIICWSNQNNMRLT